jgi:response regulator NasT
VAAIEGSTPVARTVVIAEDEAIVRLDLREILEEEGYEVVGEAGRGEEAVELVRVNEPDLVILDIKMPGMDGLQAANVISAARRTAVLILTAFSQRDLVEQARDAGAIAYLVKPFQKEELLPAIEVALGRFAEIQALAEENAHLIDEKRRAEEQLETRRWLDRAKGVLMDDHGMGEAEAFSFIQRSAMNARTTMRDVARGVVEQTITPS